MKRFQGFPSGKTRLVPIPSAFFTEILPEVEDVNTLKIMLHVFRALDGQDGPVRFLRKKDLLADETLLNSLVAPDDGKKSALESALTTVVKLGFLLGDGEEDGTAPEIFFLNSARGRDALAAFKSGKWTPADWEGSTMPLPPAWPGIFKLYEENIGPITPMVADMLQEAETLYPPSAIQFAFEEAVKRNARNWKYIDAILRKWQEKGSHGQNSRDPEKDRRKYIEGEYAEFINHE
jgi:DNA replication protein